MACSQQPTNVAEFLPGGRQSCAAWGGGTSDALKVRYTLLLLTSNCASLMPNQDFAYRICKVSVSAPTDLSRLSFHMPDTRCVDRDSHRNIEATAVVYFTGDLPDTLCNACRGRQSESSSPRNPYVRRHLQRETQAAARDAGEQHRDGMLAADEHPGNEIQEDPPSDPLNVQQFLMRDPLSAEKRILGSGR